MVQNAGLRIRECGFEIIIKKKKIEVRLSGLKFSVVVFFLF